MYMSNPNRDNQIENGTSGRLHRRRVRYLRQFFTGYYRHHGRAFAWRDPTTASFGLLLAEMLLRQTRAEQVAAVWPILIKQFPTPEDVVAADPERLFSLIAPLGLGRQRVTAIQSASAALIQRYDGKVPRSCDRLSRLPHVGIYSANAIACFSHGRRLPIVNSNVLRVLSRVFGQVFSPDNRRSPSAWALAKELVPRTGPVREHNYGLLDFAATVCKPRVPRCRDCELRGLCDWFETHHR